MLWKHNGQIKKSPSTYKANIEDTDNDSYTSVVSGELIDNPIAVGMLKLEMSWDYLTEEEAEELLQLTYKNPFVITVKCPVIPGGMLENAEYRVSKRNCEMISTGEEENNSQSRYRVSFNLMQKKLTEVQKAAVEAVNN